MTRDCCSISLVFVYTIKGPEGVQNKILWKVKRHYLSPETNEDSYSQSEIVPLCDMAPSTLSGKDSRHFF